MMRWSRQSMSNSLPAWTICRVTLTSSGDGDGSDDGWLWATTMAAAGASMASVVKTTVYLRNAEDYATFTRVRSEVFEPPYPASTAITAKLLFDDMLVEMDAVARVGEERS